MNREYSFQRPRMAGQSLANIGAPDLRGRYQPKAIPSVAKNIKSLADITQRLTGNRGTHMDRMTRIDVGRGASRNVAQRMREER